MIKWFLDEESGQGMVEYALILAFIALIVIVALSNIGTSLNKLFEDSLSKFPN